jgi:hypothetical protein
MPLDAPNLRYARREMSPKLVRARALATEIEELERGPASGTRRTALIEESGYPARAARLPGR